MRGIIFDAALVVLTSLASAGSMFLLYVIIRISPHNPEHYLQPQWQQVLGDVGLAVSFVGIPLLACLTWINLYRSLRDYARKETQ